MTEQQLIEGVIARDREAITCLVDTYQKKVIKTAYYFLGDMNDAQDLSQDIFLEILKSIGKFRQSSSLSTWIYRIAVNYSLNAARRNKQRKIFIGIEKIFGITSPENNKHLHQISVDHDSLDEHDKSHLLKKTISALPANQRTVFILSFYDDLSYKEISEVTGLSISSVESLKHRAKKNLQRKLIRHFTEYSNKIKL